MFKILLSVVYTLFFINTFSAQENKENILRNFNYIEYYKDSTIKKAMNFKDFEPVGYCIEFDNMGNPVTIGQYKSWNRFGNWLNADGTTSHYTDNVHYTRLVPGCGTGMYHNRKRFNELYEELIKKTN
jgi:hypothetical protein